MITKLDLSMCYNKKSTSYKHVVIKNTTICHYYLEKDQKFFSVLQQKNPNHCMKLTLNSFSLNKLN